MSSREDLQRELERLKDELAEIEKSRAEAEARSVEWKRRRDELNGKVKDLTSEARRYREERDRINDSIREIKVKIESDMRRLSELNGKRLGIIKELKGLPTQRIGGVKEIEEKIKKLDWLIQTTPLSVKEERSLVSEVKCLENYLLVLKKNVSLRKRLEELNLEREALFKVNRLRRTEIGKLVEESKAFHEKLVSVSRKISELKEEADQAHEMFVESLNQAKNLRKRKVEVTEKVKDIKNRLKNLYEEMERQREREVLEELRARASRKVESGEELSWEEFKALEGSWG